MKSFTIKKLEQVLEIENFKYDKKGFIYKPKKSNKVKEIVIVNQEIVSALISYNFYKNYKKILELYLLSKTEDSDTSASGLVIALDEIARLKNIILTKYKNMLKKKEAEKFLKQLKILDSEIKNKIIDLEMLEEEKALNNEVEEKRGMSR